MSIPAILLAAGKGTRLRPLTDHTPKCMVPIMGRPLLDYWITACHKAGFGPIIINTYHLADQVEQFVRQSPLSESVVLVHEKELLGTGGTILALKQLLSGTFFVAHADNLSVFDMAKFLTAHANRPQGCLMTMLLFETPTPESCRLFSQTELLRRGLSASSPISLGLTRGATRRRRTRRCRRADRRSCCLPGPSARSPPGPRLAD